ncbi:MAG: hypothetical protein WA919_19100 [Coleofasciculaceae cyanobacterium]
MKFNKWFYIISLAVLTILLSQGISLSQLLENSQSINKFTFSSKEQHELTLRVNETQVVTLDSGNFEIKLLNIEDSRCPSDVQCVWSGQVTATVSVTSSEQSLGNFDLTLRPGQANLAIQEIDCYSIKLVQVVPYPNTTQNIDILDYFTTLTIYPSNLEN